jgi:hypothetical protein
MPPFHYLVRFQSADDNLIYFADLGVNGLEQLGVVSQVDGYASVDGLIARHGGRPVRLGKVGGQSCNELVLIKTDSCTCSSNRSTYLLRWLELPIACGRSQGMSLYMLER